MRGAHLLLILLHLLVPPIREILIFPGATFMTWTQNYDPFGSALLSPLAAALPVVLLLGLLASGRVPAPAAALVGLAAAVLVAIFAFTPAEAQASDGPGRWGWASAILAAAG